MDNLLCWTCDAAGTDHAATGSLYMARFSDIRWLPLFKCGSDKNKISALSLLI